MIQIDPKGLAFLVNEWVRCEPMLQRAIDLTEGAFDLAYVWSEIAAERSQFWPMPTAAVVTRVVTYPSGLRACLHWLCGGDDLGAIAKTEAAITAWAKGQGCTRVEIVGRRGWLKALDDYRDRGTILVKEI